MAVVATATVTHVSFPSRVQYKTLEPDGLAIARLASTGDASSGNVLHTFRGQAGFLYSVRNMSAEVDEVGGTAGDLEVRFDAQWLANAAGLAQGDFFGLMSMVLITPGGGTARRVANPNITAPMVENFKNLLLGEIVRDGVHDILSMSHRLNVNTNTYVSMVLFDVYRTEALTVPGILDRLRHGLLR